MVETGITEDLFGDWGVVDWINRRILSGLVFLFRSFTLVWLWRWFVGPVIDKDILLPHAIGALLVIALIRLPGHRLKDSSTAWDILWRSYRTLMILMTGWFIHAIWLH